MKSLFFLISILFTTLSICSIAACSASSTNGIEPVKSSLLPVSNNDVHTFPAKAHAIYDVVKDIDLKGLSYKIPEDVTLRQKGGVIKNGTLIGNKTKVISKKAIFDRVKILGTWNVEEITTGLFKDLSYHNALRDVLALANPEIKNRVRFERGTYYISIESVDKVGITVPSNTNLIIDGNITLIPNNYIYYEIVNLKGHNITVSGKGSIVGDKMKHTGTKGEWGMGIYVRGKDISVRNITIRDCWGDCIYVGNNSRNVHIDQCLLDNGRRQGISITSARNVYINDCIISNVSGTAPQYAIDLEPNKGDTVTNIYIHNVTIRNCIGGITANGAVKTAYLGDVYIDNCTVDENVKQNSYQFYYANKVSMNNCIASDSKRKITFGHVNTVETKKNRVKGRQDHESYSNCKVVNGRKSF